MKIYLVGGAIRDLLLKKTPKDHDYVIVGATPDELLATGLFKPVGKSFPVFIHKDSGSEYALARTEKKIGPGHTGFKVNFSPDISLEEDLKRRDLTINSMAQDLETGKIIDPFGGQQDLVNKTLKHTSTAFSEDPLRVFRVARFAARFSEFTIDNETLIEMTKISKSLDFKALANERILKELKSSLQETCPSIFFKTLRSCGALSRLDINASFLFNLDKEEKNSFLKFLSKLSVFSLMQYNNFCEKFPLSLEERKVSSLIAEFHPTLDAPQASQILELFQRTNSFQSPKTLKKVLAVASSFLPVKKEKVFEALENSQGFPKEFLTSFKGKELGIEIKKWKLNKIKEITKK